MDSEDMTQFSSRIRKLERLLLHEDRQVKKAALMVYSDAMHPKYSHLLVQNPTVIDALVATMISGRELRDYDLQKLTLCALYSISQSFDGCEAVMRSGAIPHLVAYLSGCECGCEPFHCDAIVILHHLLSHHPNAIEPIRSVDLVLSSYVRLLERVHPDSSEQGDKFIGLVVNSLLILAEMHPETMWLLHKIKAHVHFIRILENPNRYEKLLFTTAHFILISCNFQYNKRAIIMAGGMQALTKHLDPRVPAPSSQLVSTCLNALQNLSDFAPFAKGLDCLVDRLVQFLDNDGEGVLSYCLDILYNLMCKTSRNRKRMCEKMGIESLYRVLIKYWPIPPVAEKAMGTLRHLVSRATTDVQTWRWGMEVRKSRDKLRSLGCLSWIDRCLDLHLFPSIILRYPAVTSEALFLLRNLAMDGGAWWPEFRHYRLVEATADLACQCRTHLNELVDRPQLFVGFLRVLHDALMALSVLCQCEENRRILLERTDLVDMANETINNPNLIQVKGAASKFLEAIRAPLQEAVVAPLVVMHNPIDPHLDGYSNGHSSSTDMASASGDDTSASSSSASST